MANNFEQEIYIQVALYTFDVLGCWHLATLVTSSGVLHREVFMDFDPASVSKLSERKIIAPGNPSSFLLSEQKLRGVIENARQILKVSPLLIIILCHDYGNLHS